MKVDLDWLRIKKEILIFEAEKLFDIQNKSNATDHSYLLRHIVDGPKEIKGNLPFTFVDKCIKATDDIFELLKLEKPHERCDIKFNTHVIDFWHNLNKKHKRTVPERGDIIVGSYNRQDRILPNGFLGIIKSVDANLDMEIIEASVINNYDDDPVYRQFDGIKIKTRALSGRSKSKILGVFSPWVY
jgi:hypothetical protein